MNPPVVRTAFALFVALISVTVAFGAEQNALDPRFDQLNELVADPTSPIKFDAKLNEYNLTYTNRENGRIIIHSALLKFCPFTGEALPPSKRGSLFTQPSAEELKKYEDLLSGVRSIAEVKKRLGEPDSVHKDFDDVRQQLTYSSKAKTLTVIVQELKGGSVRISYTGKEK